MNERRIAWLLFVVLVGAAPNVGRAQGPFTADFVDGTTVENKSLTDWNELIAAPKIGGRPLFDAAKPARTLRNVNVAAARPPESFVELLNGDCLPGLVVGYRAGAETPFSGQPPCVLVKPHVVVHNGRPAQNELVRVNARWIRRVVWRGSTISGPGAPATLTLRGGERRLFSNLRWTDRGVEVLTDGEIKPFALAELDQLQAPAGDPWQPLFQQIAVLSPRLQSRLVELETVDGLRLTTSTERLLPSGKTPNAEQWVHLVHPVWSLDPFTVAVGRIRQWRFFAPNEMPLSAIAPAKSRQVSLSGGGWAWQKNHSIRGGMLTGGGKTFTWGFGVLAYTELTIPLPASARSFRTLLALDDSVGAGGCARAHVYADTATGVPLFKSPLLVGAGKAVDTGAIALNGKAKALVLVADSADGESPATADPLNIRDMVNWLDPLVELDPASLKTEIERCLFDRIVAWQGWDVEGPLSAVRVVSGFSAISAAEKGYVDEVAPEGPKLTLKRRVRLPDDKRWLVVNVTRPAEVIVESKLAIRVGDKTTEFDVPLQRSWGPPHPVTVPLHAHAGQEVDIEITHRPKTERGLIQWHNVEIVAEDPFETLRPRPVEKFELALLKSYRVGMKWETPKQISGVTSYRLTRGAAADFDTSVAVPVGSVGVGFLAHADIKPVEAKTTWYAIEAVDVHGRRSPPRYLQADVPANIAPTNDLTLLAFPVDKGILLSWHGIVEEDVVAVELYRRPAGGELQKVKIPVPKILKSADKFLDKDLPPGKYRYVLKLRDRGGLESVDNREISTMTSRVIRRINFGGLPVAAPPEVMWSGNTGNSSYSSFYTSPLPIANTGPLEPIYRSERWSYNGFWYKYDVPPGRYRVVFHLAETNANFFKAGERKFNIEIDDVVVHRDVDIAGTVGPQTAMQLVCDVTTTGDAMKVTFSKSTAGPTVRAMEIYAIPD